MVKDDLDAFRNALYAYKEASRSEATHQFFRQLPKPVYYGFWFSLAVVIIFILALAVVLVMTFDKGEHHLPLLSIMVLTSAALVFYLLLRKRYGFEAETLDTYKELLTLTYYQLDRYLLFKNRLAQDHANCEFPFQGVKALIQSRLQLNEGLSVLKVYLLGVSVSVVITILFSLAPSGENEKTIYIAIISLVLLLTLLYAYFNHDPSWFRNNKYRELLHFITIYEMEMGSVAKVNSTDCMRQGEKGPEYAEV